MNPSKAWNATLEVCSPFLPSKNLYTQCDLIMSVHMNFFPYSASVRTVRFIAFALLV